MIVGTTLAARYIFSIYHHGAYILLYLREELYYVRYSRRKMLLRKTSREKII